MLPPQTLFRSALSAALTSPQKETLRRCSRETYLHRSALRSCNAAVSVMNAYDVVTICIASRVEISTEGTVQLCRCKTSSDWRACPKGSMQRQRCQICLCDCALEQCNAARGTVRSTLGRYICCASGPRRVCILVPQHCAILHRMGINRQWGWLEECRYEKLCMLTNEGHSAITILLYLKSISAASRSLHRCRQRLISWLDI